MNAQRNRRMQNEEGEIAYFLNGKMNAHEVEAFESVILADKELEKQVAKTVLMRLRKKRRILDNVNNLGKSYTDVSEFIRPTVVERIGLFIKNLFVR